MKTTAIKKRIELDKDERITLQTLIVREIKENKGYETKGLIPCFKTEYLEELYQKKLQAINTKGGETNGR